MKYSMLTKVINRELLPVDISDVEKLNRRLRKHEGKLIEVIYTFPSKDRTTSQNAYYWQVLRIAGADLGYDIEELHETFKAMFLVDRSGRLPRIRSIRELDVHEFMIYLDSVIGKLTELGIEVPEPSAAGE